MAGWVKAAFEEILHFADFLGVEGVQVCGGLGFGGVVFGAGWAQAAVGLGFGAG